MTICYNNKKISISFEIFFSVLYFSISNFSRMLELIGISRVIPYIIYIVLFAYFFIRHLKDLRFIDLVYSIFVVLCVGYGIITYGRMIDRITIYAIIISFVPAYYYFRFCNLKSMKTGFKVSNYYSIIYLLTFYFLHVKNSAGYDMNYAYWIAIPMCAIWGYYLNDKKAINLVLFFVSFITVVLSGSRGALLLSFICCLVLVLVQIKNKKSFWGIVFFATVFLIVSLFKDNILEYLSRYSDTSRNISKLLEGKLFQSDSRQEIYELCKIWIEEKPGGYGPLASRELLWGITVYPHSLYYELQLDYGKIVGLIVFGAVILTTVIDFIRYNKTGIRELVIIIAVLGIGSLIVSSSYFQEIYIPALIGLMIRMKCDKNEKQWIQG